MKKTIAILILTCFLFPVFSSAQKIPKTMEQAGEFGEKLLQEGEKQMPSIIEKIWKNEVLPVWQKIWDWIASRIGSKISSWLNPEIEKRKEIFQENFPIEKQEMEQEVKTEAASLWNKLWNKLKELIK